MSLSDDMVETVAENLEMTKEEVRTCVNKTSITVGKYSFVRESY